MKYDSFNLQYFLRNALDSNHPIVLDWDGGGDNRHTCSLVIHSKHLATKVHELSKCRFGKKAFDAAYPCVVEPNNDHSRLIGGIFDGDGCFSISKSGLMTFCIDSASKPLLEAIQKVINRLCGDLETMGRIYCQPSRSASRVDSHSLRYGTKNDVVAIGDWMYGSIDSDWSTCPEPYMVPYHLKKYKRYELYKSIVNERKQVRKEAFMWLKQEELQRDAECLLFLQKICIGMEPNNYNLQFTNRFRKLAFESIG